MDYETIIISGVTAFLGAFAAISFQSWREHRTSETKKKNVISQAISLNQQDWLLIETFLENAQESHGEGKFHIPNVMPESALSASIIEKLAEYLPKKTYELVILARVTYMSSTSHAKELRRLYYDFESRSLGAGRSMNEYEIKTLRSHMENYIKVLKNTHSAQKVARNVLLQHQGTLGKSVFDKYGALKTFPALVLIYLLVVSYASVIFYVLWRKGV